MQKKLKKRKNSKKIKKEKIPKKFIAF